MKIDIETVKKYQMTWTGHVIQVDKLDPLVTDKGSFDKARVMILPEGWPIENALSFDAFGFGAKPFYSDSPIISGDQVEFTWLPSTYTSKAGYLNVKLELLKAKRVSKDMQEQKSIAAAKMIAPDVNLKPSTIPVSGVQESDFDFGG